MLLICTRITLLAEHVLWITCENFPSVILVHLPCLFKGNFAWTWRVKWHISFSRAFCFGLCLLTLSAVWYFTKSNIETNENHDGENPGAILRPSCLPEADRNKGNGYFCRKKQLLSEVFFLPKLIERAIFSGNQIRNS